MYISYCKRCNHFSYVTKISNYCKECKNPVQHLDMTVEEFSALSANERYKLAYKLTNNTK